ncbi:nuclease [Rothia sp. HMSC066H02]|uniref:DEAD/DEAH box helicase n=1 Tax=unclassified Rothia (in: high G+C Gram-positive bacteria) TaxID=2689056 RepID=UPI0008A1504B|nr:MULTISPECIES: AAA domain-containing protein [unclassified Rothia (in: high G+C Gram-positive bacteria)]OFO95503.1 nuclease [Rothia sp. HMSC065D09]OFP14795.1 nuclease [Rothia sp. HMSC066H02]
MDLTFTLADLTATSVCELRLYTELRERAQMQSVHPTPEKSERAHEAYRECLQVLTEGGMVGSGVVSGEHAGGTARPVPLVATSATGLTYTVELDRLDCPVANSTAESNTARIVCTPHLGEAAHRALLRGALAAHLLTASATESAENTKNAARLDLYLDHGAEERGAESNPEPAEHHSPVPQPHRVDSVRILPLIRLQEQRLLLLTEALNEGVEPAELAERIPYFLTCGECPACLNAAASLALATEAPELVTEDTAEDTAEDPETEEHPVMYRVPAAVENDSEQYHLQCLLDAQLASLEEHAAERGWGAGELEAAMLLSMTNYHRRERAPFWREHIRRLEDGPTAWVASRDYAYLDRVQVLSVEHAHALLNTPADLEALAAAMKEPAEVEDAPGWYRVRGAQVRLLRARIDADPSLVIAPSDRAVFCAYEAGLSPQIALDRMESQVNYFRASNPGERVPAELAATGFFGMRVLTVAQGGFGAGSVDSADSADPEEAAAESGKSTGESAGEFLEVLLQERIRVKDEPHGALPSGIGPGDPVSTATIEAALQADVHGLLFGGALMPNDSVLNDPVPREDSEASSESAETPDPSRTLPSVLDAAASLTGVKSASTDLLFRRAPRMKRSTSNTKNVENLPLEVDFSGSDLPTVDAVHAAVRALDHSYVAVQGPPGAGKTFLASHVIARLVAEGAKVGVVAQSHAVIENLMLACCARDGFDVSRAVRLRGKSMTPDAPWSEVSDSELTELISGAGGLLFGGTVWDYVSERRVPAGSLDVLVVDEAGQFSLTNTVAAARAARSVLLLGDPQQLPQVSTGVHPYPVDVSALGWLSDGVAALNPRFGYFLGESWRMDSALCERVSWLSYDGALASAAATAGRALQGVAPGVVSYPVEHAGCSVRSVQEAQAVVDCVRELLGREWVPAAGAEPRPLVAEDCIVVAAYNAQVDCVREALIAAGLADSSGAGVRVGTVDKFQGQEAAVVLVSLASSRVDSGRGAGFVLSPNRLNVAVSRGQWQAVLVHSPWVARSVPQDVEEVLALSGFAGLVE